MAKKNKNKNGFQHLPMTPPKTSQETAAIAANKQQQINEIEKIYSTAIDEATEDDIQAIAEADIVPEITNLDAALRKAQEAIELGKRKEKKAVQDLNEIEKEREEIKTLKAELKNQSKKVDAKEKRLESEQKKIDENTEKVLKQEEDIKKRELNAEAGFIVERRDSLKRLEEEAVIVRQDIARARELIADESSQWENEKLKAHKNLSIELSKQRTENENHIRLSFDGERTKLEQEKERLNRIEHDLNTKILEIDKTRRLLDFEKQDLEELRENLDQRAEQRSAAREESLKFEIKALQSRFSEACADRDKLDETLRDREEMDRRFGHKTPESVLEELRVITKDRDKMQKSLASRPSTGSMERLTKLESEREDWEGEHYRISQECQEYKRRLDLCTIAVTELESLRDHKNALETSRNLLQAALKELRADVDELTRRADGKSPFPSCMQMDIDKNFQSSQRLYDHDDILNLVEFTKDLQHRIACDPEASNPLYYSLRDLRCFLGGLATSKLHLLQGISGTGKTSLPMAFSRAVGAGWKVVEVQAGWRDRQDLIGHFNTFEKRFYESEFLQALYEAQCPLYADRPYIIVLDEMNLSHPEQYFADLLSALELDPKLRKLDLMTASVEPSPSLLKNGRTLAIPDNVWFVGTANHDETTKDFADKTYDRAHVMELPSQRDKFTPQITPAREPVAFESLEKAFKEARDCYVVEARASYKFIDDKYRDFLGKHFRLGWGNRLERQMLDFVPVIIAAGGTVGEATDHILATKLLRKIRDRHDIDLVDLSDLKKIIEESWIQLDHHSKPVRSIALINDELRRLGSKEENL